jgi:serine/threonine-protein kinase
MAVTSATDFLAALRANTLLTPEQLDQAAAHPAAREGAPYELAQFFEVNGWLTRFQVEQVLRGQGDQLVLGPYVLMERVGKGAGGDLFKAHYAATNSPVTFKRLRGEAFPSEEARERFLRDVIAAAQLSHPHLARVHDAGMAGDSPYLTREYVPGVDLDRLVRETGPLPAARACDLVRQAALGLQHAHDNRLVHGDVRPGHLIAVPVGAPADAAAPTPEQLRQSPGTFVKVIDVGPRPAAGPESASGYLAPEQCLRVPTADALTDQYGLGATLYFLLTGKAPVEPGADAVETMQAVVMGTPAPVESLRTDVPPAVAAVVRRAMAKRPAERFESAAALAAALEPYCHDPPPEAAPAPAPWPANGEADHWPPPADHAADDHPPAPWLDQHPGDHHAGPARPPVAPAPRPARTRAWVMWLLLGLFLHGTAIAICVYFFFPSVLVTLGLMDAEEEAPHDADNPQPKKGPGKPPPKRRAPEQTKPPTGRPDE